MCRGDCTLFWLGNPPSRALYLGDPPQKHRQNRLPHRLHLSWLGSPPSLALYLGEPPPEHRQNRLPRRLHLFWLGSPPLCVLYLGEPPHSSCVLECGQKVGLGCAPRTMARSGCFFLPPAPPLRSHKNEWVRFDSAQSLAPLGFPVRGTFLGRDLGASFQSRPWRS